MVDVSEPEKSVPPPHVKPLGRMVANFANLEMYIAWLAHILISRDQIIGRIVTARMSFGNTVAVVGALARHQMVGSSLDELLTLLKRSSALEERRNTLTHSVWTLAADQEQEAGTIGRLKFKLSSKKGYVEEVEDLPIADIDALANDIRVLMEDIMKWLNRVELLDAELATRINADWGDS